MTQEEIIKQLQEQMQLLAEKIKILESKQSESINLSPRDQLNFANDLLADEEPNQALKNAFNKHILN